MASTGICVQVYSSIATIQQKLMMNGFAYKTKYTEFDTYYTHMPRSLVKTLEYRALMQNTILLRTVKGNGNESNFIIYKNKTLNSQNEVIKEEKVQSEVSNMEETKRIFSLAGMNSWCRIVIEEMEYIKGTITISIQYVAGLGTFLEVEEHNITSGTNETKFRELVYLANSLGLDIGKDFSCKKNYMLYKKSNA